LVQDLAETKGPLVVMGDFNSDHRDPRPEGGPNPANQPESSDACPAQADSPMVQTADAECSPYWTMRQAGFLSAGPDDFDPASYSYGASALLAGPDPDRLREALKLGNPYGFTDRLDYVFIRGGVAADSAELTGNIWPNGPRTWSCNDPEQVANTAAAGQILAEAGKDAPAPGSGICLPSDHAGVVATLTVDPAATVADDPAPVEHDPFRLVWWHILLVVVLAIGALIWWRIRRRRRRRAARASDQG
jgi:hypothetical protein